MLKIYNTLAREKQVFTPIVAGKVSMYVCGMTVYDYCHLGHARVMVVFDMVSRWLRASGYEVTYVRNITDIDDKIIKRANENNETIGQLTQRFIDAMDEDSAKLGVLRPTLEPRATEYVDGMLKMIATLIEKGFAYVAANGDVFYSVNHFEGYGKLSGKSLEDLRAGERVEVDTFKKDPMDFVLWKAAKPNEPSWDSPFGGPSAGKGLSLIHISTKRFLMTEQGKARSDSDSAESNRNLALMFQSQGQLDMAFDRFRKCPIDDSVMDGMYTLGLDFERKRQFNKAESVFAYMAKHNANYKDLAKRVAHSRAMAETVILGGTGSARSSASTLILNNNGVEKPMLGRYQVEKELGKGAMGVVYLGRDPKIGRVVAIKTMDLSQAFEEDELEEVKKRFFREAETAGKLNHPNICLLYTSRCV